MFFWYLPYAQHAGSPTARRAVFTVRAATSPDAVCGSVRAAIRQVDPTLPVFDVESIQELYWESLGEQRLGAVLSGLFASFGLVMAALGVGGVMAHSVSRRVHEIGLRIALGAAPRDILLSVFVQGVRWTGLGVAIGIGGSLALSKWLVGLEPEIENLNVSTLAFASLLLVLVALTACYVPARRAVRIDPLTALHSE